MLEYVLMYFKKATVIDFLVLNTTITSAHLWFLPALIYCYFLQLLAKNIISEKVLFVVSFVLMMVYLTTSEVLGIFKIEVSKYIFTNVLFKAFPQFVLGMFIRKYKSVIKEKFFKIQMLIILAIGVIETVVSVIIWGNSITYIGSILIVVALLFLAIKYENNSYDSRLVKLSSCNTNIYVFHVAIGGTLQTILDYVGIGTNILWINVKPVIVFILSIFISLFISLIIDRFHKNHERQERKWDDSFIRVKSIKFKKLVCRFIIFTYIKIFAICLALQVFATTVANVLCTFCNIDGVAKMPLQASIFTPGCGSEGIQYSRGF